MKKELTITEFATKKPVWNKGACMSKEDRFWSKIVKSEGCWKWVGTLTDCGYGEIKIGRKHLKAHRVSFEIHKRFSSKKYAFPIRNREVYAEDSRYFV